jgi:hypothetical protein
MVLPLREMLIKGSRNPPPRPHVFEFSFSEGSDPFPHNTPCPCSHVGFLSLRNFGLSLHNRWRQVKTLRCKNSGMPWLKFDVNANLGTSNRQEIQSPPSIMPRNLEITKYTPRTPHPPQTGKSGVKNEPRPMFLRYNSRITGETTTGRSITPKTRVETSKRVQRAENPRDKPTRANDSSCV